MKRSLSAIFCWTPLVPPIRGPGESAVPCPAEGRCPALWTSPQTVRGTLVNRRYWPTHINALHHGRGRLNSPFGPPGSNGNFAWLQLAWSRLAEDGTAVLVMPAGAAFSLSARDAAIRREMIARRALVGVVALPPNLFSHTSIAVHLWVLGRE